jgi:surface antigen
MKRARIRQLAITLSSLFICAFVSISLPQLSMAKDKKDSKNSSSIKFAPVAKNGQTFNKDGGQCVGFVKDSRQDLKRLGPVGTAKNMPNVAKGQFKVNSTPKAGSAMVMDKVGNTGHVELVEKVKKGSKNKETLTIIDANSKGDYMAGKGSTVSERTVQYDKKTGMVKDSAFKNEQHVVFIGKSLSEGNKKTAKTKR